MKNIFRFYRTYHLIETAPKTFETCSGLGDASPFVLVFSLADCYWKNKQGVIAERAFNEELEKTLMAEYKKTKCFNFMLAPPALRDLAIRFGSVARGLRKFYKKDKKFIEENTFYPKAEHINKDLNLLKILKELPYRKICLINCPVEKAASMLNELGLQEYCDQICCTSEIFFKSEFDRYTQISKELKSFIKQLELHENTKMVFFDYFQESLTAVTIMGHISYRLKKYVRTDYNLKGSLKEFKREHHDQHLALVESMTKKQQLCHEKGLRRIKSNKSELGMQIPQNPLSTFR